MYIRLPNIICLDKFPIENCWHIYNAMYNSHTNTIFNQKYSPFSVFTVTYPTAFYESWKPIGLNVINTESVTKIDRVLYNDSTYTDCENVSDKYSTFLIFGSIDLINYLRQYNNIVNYKYLININALNDYYDGLSNLRFNPYQSLIMNSIINHNFKLGKFEYDVRPFGPLWKGSSRDNPEESFTIENNSVIDYLQYCNYLFNQLQNLDTYCPTYTFSEIQVPILLTIAKTDFSKLNYSNSYLLQVDNTALQNACKRSMAQNLALLKYYPECLWLKDIELESTAQRPPSVRDNTLDPPMAPLNHTRVSLNNINWDIIEAATGTSATSSDNSF